MRNHRDRAQLPQIQAHQGALSPASRTWTLFSTKKQISTLPLSPLPTLPTCPNLLIPRTLKIIAAHHELVTATAAQGTRACPASRPAILAAPGVSTDGSVCPILNQSLLLLLTFAALQIPSDHTPSPTSTCEAATAAACVRGASASAFRARFPATAASSPSEQRRRWGREFVGGAVDCPLRPFGLYTALLQPRTLGFFMEIFTTIMTSLHIFPFFACQYTTHSPHIPKRLARAKL